MLVQAIDAQGRVYYWHKITRKTSWRLPETATKKPQTPQPGVWGTFSACSTTCGEGYKTRACIGGNQCHGGSKKKCTLGSCPAATAEIPINAEYDVNLIADELYSNFPLIVDENSAIGLLARLALHIINSQGTEKKMPSTHFLASVSRLASLLALSMPTNHSANNKIFGEILASDTDTTAKIAKVVFQT